jgi:4-amino-4-deoxy-L-arabinose transferase-like glycosyltransferase
MSDKEAKVLPVGEMLDRHLGCFSRWWPGLVILLLVGGVLSSGLSQRTHARIMENISVGSSQETWLRAHGYERGGYEQEGWRASLLPSFNGVPRVVKPPMLVWVNNTAMIGSTPELLDFQGYLTRVRWVAVGMALLMLLGTYWAGLSLGDRWLAVLATVMSGSTWYFVKMGQTAAFDIHLAGWGTLAVASALWALNVKCAFAGVSDDAGDRGEGRGLRSEGRAGRDARPTIASYSLGPRTSTLDPAPERERHSRARWGVGWGMVALATGAAYMTKGPLALLIVGGPVLLMVLLTGGWRRIGAGVLGLLIASGFSLAVFGAWFLYVRGEVPALLEKLAQEYAAERAEDSPWYFYVGLLGMVLPWTPYLIAGLLHPWIAARGPERRLRLLPWVWFVLILVAFSLAGAKQQRYILPIVPAASLMMAWAVRDHAWLAWQGGAAKGAWFLQRPIWVGLLLASLAMPALLCTQQGWVDRDVLPKLITSPISVTTAAVWGAALMLLAVGTAWLFEKHRPSWAVIVAGLWCGVFMFGHQAWYAQLERESEPSLHGAMRVAAIVGEGGLVAMMPPPEAATQQNVLDQEEMIALLRRRIETVSPEAIAQRVQAGERLFVLTEPTDAADALMRITGLLPMEDIVVDHVTTRRMWGLP